MDNYLKNWSWVWDEDILTTLRDIGAGTDIIVFNLSRLTHIIYIYVCVRARANPHACNERRYSEGGLYICPLDRPFWR